ncbi:MAG: hypothetical protein AAF481_01075 [Acidobacteriota bacterium]
MITKRPQPRPRFRRHSLAVVLGLTAVLMNVSPAWAGRVNCTGKVLSIKKWPLSNQGHVAPMIELETGEKRSWIICTTNPDSTFSSSTPEECKQLLTMLLYAKAKDELVTVSFDQEKVPSRSGGIGVSACSEVAQNLPEVMRWMRQFVLH